MFKAKVYFEDGGMEYVIVAGYDVDSVMNTVNEEFYYKPIKNYTIERISDAPMMTVISVDAYDAIESCL